jgi:hypothetical protein
LPQLEQTTNRVSGLAGVAGLLLELLFGAGVAEAGAGLATVLGGTAGVAEAAGLTGSAGFLGSAGLAGVVGLAGTAGLGCAAAGTSLSV